MLILASASPRRRQLLAQAGYLFEVQEPSIQEAPRPGEDAIHLATRLAREKATAVFALRHATQPDPELLLVLGADTVVICDGEIDREILGKPSSAADAARMLRMLSGRTHQVVTGVAVAARCGSQTALETAAEVTLVTMRALSEAEISAYAATAEPMDKAGAYAIQGYAGRWVPRIQGCYFNVMGLPLALVANLLDGCRERVERALPTPSPCS